MKINLGRGSTIGLAKSDRSIMQKGTTLLDVLSVDRRRLKVVH